MVSLIMIKWNKMTLKKDEPLDPIHNSSLPGSLCGHPWGFFWLALLEREEWAEGYFR